MGDSRGDLFAGLDPLDPSHVHSNCGGVATITYRRYGAEHSWGVGVGCRDTEASMRAHLKRWVPDAEFISVVFKRRESTS